MHTTRTEHVTFAHNGDYSGPILFTGPDELGRPVEVACPFSVLATAALEHAGLPDGTVVPLDVHEDATDPAQPYGREVRTALPLAAVRALVGNRVRDERIAALEQASAEDLCLLGATSELLTWAREHAGP